MRETMGNADDSGYEREKGVKPGQAHAAGQAPGGPVSFSVIGLQNSGKTRFVLSAIRLLRTHGLAVAVLKHDGHADADAAGTKKRILDWEKQGSDTMLASEAGAAMTMVTGGGQSLLHFADDKDSPQVHNLLKRMAKLAEHSGQPLDVIIVEGFKKSKLPKVFICRNEGHVSWLRDHWVDTVQAVVVPLELLDTADLSWPIFDESHMKAILQACGVRF